MPLFPNDLTEDVWRTIISIPHSSMNINTGYSPAKQQPRRLKKSGGNAFEEAVSFPCFRCNCSFMRRDWMFSFGNGSSGIPSHKAFVTSLACVSGNKCSQVTLWSSCGHRAAELIDCHWCEGLSLLRAHWHAAGSSVVSYVAVSCLHTS